MKNLIIIASLALCSCIHQKFYVKDSEELNGVTVKECVTVTFKEVESGDVAKKKACFDRKLSSIEKEKYVRVFKTDKKDLQTVMTKSKEQKDESGEE